MTQELKRQGWNLNRIVNEVCRMFSVDPDDLHKKGRANDLSSAKGLICYLGYCQLGINGKELARYFGISRPLVSQAIMGVALCVKGKRESQLFARRNQKLKSWEHQKIGYIRISQTSISLYILSFQGIASFHMVIKQAGICAGIPRSPTMRKMMSEKAFDV
ncbi:MAG: hypothetical protein JRJ42_11795 [Deltaproteobacteria bacterium]|nr:hypothetical protein [Deltaproteobacteria bacterium]